MTRLAFLHRAVGLILPEHRVGVSEGWRYWLERIRRWRNARVGRRHRDERLLRCRQQPEIADVGAKRPRDSCLGPAGCHPGVGAQVSRLPGGARGALDRTRPVAFDGNLPALGAAGPLRRLIALSGRGTSGSHRAILRDFKPETEQCNTR